MTWKRSTTVETAARFRASYERRNVKMVADPALRRRLGAVAAACKAAGRPVPVWVRVQLFSLR